MDVVCFGDRAWQDVDDAEQGMLGELAARGHRVLYVASTVTSSVASTATARWAAPHLIAPRLHVLAGSDVAAVRRAMRRLDLRHAVALVSDARGARLAQRAGAQAHVLHASSASHARTPIERATVRDADVVVVDSPSLRREWVGINAETYLLPADDRVDALERALASAIREAETRRLRPAADVGAPLDPTASPPLPEMHGLSRLQAAWRAAARVAGRVYHAGRLLARAAGGRPARVRRILVARGQCRLGDVVVMGPALVALRRRYPDARIVLGAPIELASLVLGPGAAVDAVEPLDFLRHATRRGRVLGALRLFARGYDLVVSGAAYFVTVEPFLSGAPCHVGLDNGHPLQRLNDRVLPLDPMRHEAENNLRLIEGLGVRLERAARVPTVGVDAATARVAVAKLLATRGIPADAPLLTLHAGAQKPSRRWAEDRFASVAERLLRDRPHLHVALTGGEGERATAEQVRAAVPHRFRDRVHVLAGATDLVGLVGVLDHSAAAVCNDTGVLHLARARGTPLVAVLGPENDRRWGPHPDGRGPAVALRHVVPCAPCSRWACAGQFCLALLEPHEVARHVGALLDGKDVTVDAGSGITPLKRVQRAWSWTEVADAGLDVPLVSVLLFPGGWTGDLDRPSAAADVTAMLDALARQCYPNIEAIVVRHAGADGPVERTASSVRVREVAIGAAEAGNATTIALAAARGTFVVTMPPSIDWLETKLADDVSWLVRSPEAMATAGAVRLSADVLAAAPGVTFRRVRDDTGVRADARASDAPSSDTTATRAGADVHPAQRPARVLPVVTARG